MSDLLMSPLRVDAERVRDLLAAVLSPDFNTDVAYRQLVLDEVQAVLKAGADGQRSEAGG